MSLGSEFMRHILSREPEAPFRPLGYHVEFEREGGATRARATVRLEVAGRPEQRAAEGANSVEALERALRSTLFPHYPEVDRFHLADYQVNLIDASQCQVRIFTRNGTKSWTTEAISSDLNQASYDALAQSFAEGISHASQSHTPAW